MTALRRIPTLLIVLVLVSVTLELPLDLAAVEAFDAWLWKSAAVISIALLAGGFLLSTRVPMAYCHYACPTGAMLRFMRSHGHADHWQRSDTVALALLLLAFGLVQSHGWIQAVWVQGGPAG